jgi:hypothetical protein
MFGLIALALILVWLFASIALARWVGRWVPHGGVRFLVTVLLAPILFALPLADEIIGKTQFDKLCEDAKEIRIHGTIPVGEELYFSDGRWRRADREIPLAESNRITDAIEALLEYETTPYQPVDSFMPIATSEVRIKDRRTGNVLAVYREFITRGGWISRSLEKPLLSRDGCAPEERGPALQQTLLPFNKSQHQGGTK